MSKAKTSNKLKKVNFNDLFLENSDGSLTPKRIIQVGSVTFGPGVSFGPGAVFSNIDFFAIKGNEIAITEDSRGTAIIKGYYINN